MINASLAKEESHKINKISENDIKDRIGMLIQDATSEGKYHIKIGNLNREQYIMHRDIAIEYGYNCRVGEKGQSFELTIEWR